jgi:hypothetical protein
MIIYGTSSKDLGTRKIQGVRCTNCEANEIYVNAISRYADVFWIPVFPYAKKFFSVCKNCDQVLEKKEMPQQLKDKIEIEKHHFKTPFYLFSGLIIIALIIAYAFYASNQHDVDMANNVKNIEANDVIVFKEKSKEYSFAKVTEIRSDTIIVQYGQYVYEGGYSAPSESEFNSKKATVNDFYEEDLSFFLQSEIDSLYGSGDLVEIYK